MTDPTTWDLSGGAPLVGHNDALVGMMEALRRYGARSIELGYRWDPAWGPDTDEAEPPPGVPVTVFVDVELESAGRSRKHRTRWHDVAEVVAEPGGLTYAEATIEALMKLVRRRGGHVSVVRT